MDYTKFIYEGPVKEFSKVIANNWSGSTYAPSEKKARSNLEYQFKKEYGREKTAKISLPGKITRVDN
jgi:hypothetical protein